MPMSRRPCQSSPRTSAAAVVDPPSDGAARPELPDVSGLSTVPPVNFTENRSDGGIVQARPWMYINLMTDTELRLLLDDVRAGKLPVDEAKARLSAQAVGSLDYAQVDLERRDRCGFPEVIFCTGKT